MEAKFTGPSYTLGVEEELMILDAETFDLANEIEAVVDAYEGKGEVKPELLQSVLEIATPPCADVAEAGRHVRSLRREVEHPLEVVERGEPLAEGDGEEEGEQNLHAGKGHPELLEELAQLTVQALALRFVGLRHAASRDRHALVPVRPGRQTAAMRRRSATT